MVASVKLPTETVDGAQHFEIPAAKHKLNINIKILHRGEINRARLMPQNPFIVATKSPSEDVFIFDMSKHPSIPCEERGFCPEHRCTGHEKEGYGLSWSPHHKGRLLSGSDDAQICLWDINEAGESIPCVSSWCGHSQAIEDVAWHLHCQHVFGSVSDDKSLLLWDSRANRTTRPIIQVKHAHSADINSLAFSPQNEYLSASASADRTIKIWDFRNTSEALHILRGHQGEVLQLQWAPFDGSLVASCGADRRVILWDVSKIGTRPMSQATTTERVPAELLFVHGGHTSTVSDLCWSSSGHYLLASASEDNVLQIWKPADVVWNDDRHMPQGAVPGISDPPPCAV
mmetsp:Transcript_19713/g.61728  ORF Transcript_19713/g.61728 Transcript_19713/m.61728 type:complete len:344 (+) Transcript_19713:387-1418(+)